MVILILHIFEKGPMYLLKRLIYCRLTGGTRLANFSFPKWTEETSNALWGQNLNADLIAGRI